MRCRIALQQAADLEAVHIRHHHVEQHDVTFGALAGHQSLRAIVGGSDVEILG